MSANLSEQVIAKGKELGFDLVGITSAAPFEHYERELQKRKDYYSWLDGSPVRLLDATDPGRVLPGAESIVVAVKDYTKEGFPSNLLGVVGKSYLTRYALAKSKAYGAMLKGMAGFLKEKGMQVESRAALPDRAAAERAGMVTRGRNTFVYAEGMGSYLFIHCFVVDKELDCVEQESELACSEGCTECMDSCPTGALYEPLHMNPLQCIAFNSYASEDLIGTGWEMPPEIREKMGSWIFGCDICQDACPHNKKALKKMSSLPPNPELQQVSGHFDLKRLLNIDEENYSQYVQPLTYYIRQKKYIQRNAAIALGNLGDEEAVPFLKETAAGDPEPLVRANAAWALGKIGTPEALEFLQEAKEREGSAEVQKEIDGALERA